jgi:hypothetical protein
MRQRPVLRVADSGDNLSTYERCARLIEKYAKYYIETGGGAISGTSRPRKQKLRKKKKQG